MTYIFKSTSLFLVTIFAFIELGTATSYLEYDGRIIIDLQHAIDIDDFDKFSYRGNITITSLNSGLSNVIQNPLLKDEQNAITTMAMKNEFYRLKATVLYPDGKTRTFLTSSKACALFNAQLNDEFWIPIDGNGYVNAVTHTISQNNFGLDCSKANVNALLTKKFNTDVFVKHTELAPVPDTASYLQKLERERLARERGETKDNRGFFAKYWMYIVPVVLLIFISGATSPEQPK